MRLNKIVSVSSLSTFVVGSLLVATTAFAQLSPVNSADPGVNAAPPPAPAAPRSNAPIVIPIGADGRVVADQPEAPTGVVHYD